MLNKAMIFAAGRGSRMKELSENCPKPMLQVAGRSIIQRLIDELPSAGIEEVVVNLHYKGDMLEEHLQSITEPSIVFSKEEDLLETGGGAKKALPYFNNEPFWSFNGDMLWRDGSVPMLDRMKQAWDPKKMDILLLVHPKDQIPGFDGNGDYLIDEQGRLTRCQDGEGGPYVFAGARIASPHIFEGVDKDRFSFLELFDKAQEQGRLYGVVHDGMWFHLSNPHMLSETEKIFLERKIA